MDDQPPNYCPDCGDNLTSRKIEDRVRAYCASCANPVYRNPKPCAGVLVVEDNQLLLVKRTEPPSVGRWSLPAGFLEHDEPPETGAVRELEEETGITVSEENLELFDTAFVTGDGRDNVLVIIYRIRRSATEGEPKPGSDAGRVRFWNLEAFEGSEERIEPGYEDIFRQARTL